MAQAYEWEPENYYGVGEVVEYEGHQYNTTQAHQAHADQTPPVTPMLWQRLPEEPTSVGEPNSQRFQDGYSPSYLGQDDHAESSANRSVDSSSLQSERNTNDKRKEGGLLAGIAGVFASSKSHEKRDEENKAAREIWLQEARTRTEQYLKDGPQGPVTWILHEGKNIPEGALVGGEYKGQSLYICRAFHEGGIQVGKASSSFKKGAVIGYAHNEIHLDTYEILIADHFAVRWVDGSGRLNLQKLGARPVEGGREGDGTPLYVAKAHHRNTVCPGKISEKLDGAFIPYDNTEKKIRDYRVLCYNY